MTRRIDITWPDGGDDAWNDSGPAGQILRDAFFQPVTQVSFAYLGLPPGWLQAAQQVGDFTQSATADVTGGGGTADFAASQTVGDFAQSATATVQVDAAASQTVGAFTQSATATVWAQAQATQQVGDFSQSATADVRVDAQVAQTVGDFAQSATAEVVGLADFAATQQVGDFGQTASVENDSAPPAEQSVTPGYPSRSYGYRVRVGKRWLRVDPLDPLSVRAAYAAAEEAAQEAAESRVVDPQRSAVATVRVEPPSAPSVDYAALRDESRRIAEQVRAVYAEALQRELIARLMREADERDEDEAVLLLLG